MNVYCSFFKLLQWFFIWAVYQNHLGACTSKTQLTAPSSPTFKFMKLRLVFLVGSQTL